MYQQETAFENIVGKEEIAHNEQFLLFPQCFRLNQEIISTFVNIFEIVSLFTAELEKPKIGISGKGLKLLIKYTYSYPFNQTKKKEKETNACRYQPWIQLLSFSHNSRLEQVHNSDGYPPYCQGSPFNS